MNPHLDPYTAPQSQPDDDVYHGELTAPRKVAGMRGAAWIGEGYRLFRLAPGNWILMLLVYWFLIMALSILPLVSILVTVVQPIFMAGMFYATFQLEQHGKLQVDDVFSGFRQQLGPLAIVGLITLGCSIVVFGGVFLAMLGSVGLELLSGNIDNIDPDSMDWYPFAMKLMLAVLIGLALYIPIVMASWFAPVLVMLHQVPAVEAMKMSFWGCAKNIWPFLLYGLITLFWVILAALPLFLGFLVLAPVMMASIYCGYKDIFLSGGEANHPHPDYA